MDVDELRALFAEAITDIQRQSGHDVRELDDELRTFSDLEGFNSLNGEEVTTLLLDDLDFDPDLDLFNSDDNRELTIGEIITRPAKITKRKEKRS